MSKTPSQRWEGGGVQMRVINIFQQGKVSKSGRVAGDPTVHFKLVSSSCPIIYFKLVLFVSIRRGDDKGNAVTVFLICPRNSSIMIYHASWV